MKRWRLVAMLLLSLCLAGMTAPGAAATVARPGLLGSGAVAQTAARAKAEAPQGGHEHLFDWFNFILLIVVLVYVLRKPLASFFRNRSREIERALEEGRKALEAAQAQLSEAEHKLLNLEREIDDLKSRAAKEREREIENIRRASSEEVERILESARTTIASATQAARLEIKRLAAAQAVALAEKMIRNRLDEPRHAALVNQFIEGISKDGAVEPRT